MFDGQAADFILSNMAVLADRLEPNDYDLLSRSAIGQIAVVVHVAQDIAPLADKDTEKSPHETDQQHEYRISVRQPLHSLQRKVYIRNYDLNNSTEMSKLRFGVDAAGKAFQSVLLETKSLPAIAETESYFWSNVTAAARSVKMVQESQQL